MNINEGVMHAAAMNAQARHSQDCQKGIAAFLNKEELKW
jgi:methylglutaconyl-CoA hydratase